MKTQSRRTHANCIPGRNRQAGATLMEAMIALALSMLVTTSMVVLMANSMGTSTRVIQMSQLTDQLRNTMSMLSRDVRRANYSANAAYCYANADCGLDGSANQFADISIVGGSCFIFGLDRNSDGDASSDPAGGFRRVTNAAGVGLVEIWVGGSSPSCTTTPSANDDWVEVTDPDFVNITAFTVNNDDSFSGSVAGEGGSIVTQWARQINVQLAGQLIRDTSITRQINDVIKVRNDYITKT